LNGGDVFALLRARACAYTGGLGTGLDSDVIMQTTSPVTPASPIEVPEIDSDEPVVVIPVASVAPLDGEPDGERINTFALAPKSDDAAPADVGANMRERVLAKPLTYVAAAFSLGYILARALR
jgi:hypothetical protein